MFFPILRRSFLHQKKAVAVMVVATAAGTAIAASLLALSFDISSKVSSELRSYGANILIQPRLTGAARLAGQKRYLQEADLVKAKTIFWRHNIVGIAPMLAVRDADRNVSVLGTWYRKMLPLPGETGGYATGVFSVMPWWSVEGQWPKSDREILAGAGIAAGTGRKIGDPVTILGRRFVISGILTTGGREDDMFVGDLATVQRLAGLEGKLSQVFVSAVTTPMDAFAYKDPATMTRTEYEKWYCTAYATSISKQLESDAVFAGATARPIWPVAETEGTVLRRLSLLLYLLTTVTLLSAALGVSSTMIASLLRRTDEIALMKTMGADSFQTAALFLTEALVTGALGGVIGYGLSLGICGYLGVRVFGTALEQKAILFPITMGASLVISLAAAWLPIRRALDIRPAAALKGARSGS